VAVIAGRVPSWALNWAGYGSGYGCGDGSGHGAEAGPGDWDWAGSGYGYGYGCGTGAGCGDGYGYWAGYGCGDGYGCEDGDWAGYGDGAGDTERSTPAPVTVRVEQLGGACASHLRRFRRVFPDGAEYPRDLLRALDAGLDVSWAQQKLGLLPVLTDGDGEP
jgi:hypothetical protein